MSTIKLVMAVNEGRFLLLIYATDIDALFCTKIFDNTFDYTVNRQIDGPLT